MRPGERMSQRKRPNSKGGERMPLYDLCLVYGCSAAITFVMVIAPVMLFNYVCRARKRASAFNGQCR